MKRVLASVILCLGAIPTFAQFDMSSMALMMGSPAAAMMRGDIRKELKLSKAQDQSISKIEKSLGGMNGGRGNDPNAMMAAFGMMDKYDQANKDIEALLDDNQKSRLTQIRIQMMGPPGLQSPLVADALELTDDQKQKVKDIQSGYFSDMMNAAHSRSASSISKTLVKKRAEADAKLLDLLTDAQKAKYKEIQGAPFKDARQKDPIM